MASMHDTVDRGNTMAYVHASYIKVTLGHTSIIDQRNTMA